MSITRLILPTRRYRDVLLDRLVRLGYLEYSQDELDALIALEYHRADPQCAAEIAAHMTGACMDDPHLDRAAIQSAFQEYVQGIWSQFDQFKLRELFPHAYCEMVLYQSIDGDFELQMTERV